MNFMETKKEPKRDPVRKGPDKKPSPVNNNLILLLLGIGAVLFVVVTVFNNGSEVNIPTSDLIELIKRTDPQAPSEASVLVPLRTGPVTYSDLSELRLHPY